MERIKLEQAELGENFCRGCGYCKPCAKNIEINMCARMPSLLRRSKWERFVTPEWQSKMALIDECIDFGQCKPRCPYKLDCPSLLRAALKDYREFLTENLVT